MSAVQVRLWPALQCDRESSKDDSTCAIQLGCSAAITAAVLFLSRPSWLAIAVGVGNTVFSAAAFAAGALPPVLLARRLPGEVVVHAVVGATALFPIVLGAVSARSGGAPVWRGSLRLTFWGLLAMALTALVGGLFGAVA